MPSRFTHRPVDEWWADGLWSHPRQKHESESHHHEANITVLYCVYCISVLLFEDGATLLYTSRCTVVLRSTVPVFMSSVHLYDLYGCVSASRQYTVMFSCRTPALEFFLLQQYTFLTLDHTTLSYAFGPARISRKEEREIFMRTTNSKRVSRKVFLRCHHFARSPEFRLKWEQSFK